MADLASASAPTTRPVRGSIKGWNWTSICSCAIANSSVQSHARTGRAIAPGSPRPQLPMLPHFSISMGA